MQSSTSNLELFPREAVAGVFRGFREGGLEFHADLVLPYKSEYQRSPMFGQFLLIQLETPNEAVLGRIASFSSEGKLSFGAGEEFSLRALQEARAIPEDLKEQYLKYRVNVRVLGVVRLVNGGQLTFVPSQRRLPHVGSPVAFPSSAVLQELAGHNAVGAPLGHLALGEYVYAHNSDLLVPEAWMQIRQPEVLVKFPVESLVARRSFIFARAGFGKSNLNKLLFSQLYATTPTVRKRGGRNVPVGTLIFDPDGEYFWPDDKGRPGLCDVAELEDKLVVFTARKNASPFYQSFVAGGVKLDLRRLKPGDVFGIALNAERHEQQNVRKLRSLNGERWEKLVNLIDEYGNQAELAEICKLLDLDKDRQEVEAIAARSNATAVIKMLHDRSSQLMDKVLAALRDGKLCILDVSQMRGEQALILSGLLLRRIFEHNQAEFTAAEPKTIPTIAVVEEAQSVLTDRSTAAEPYISWVKEGRKYDLGALLITQQPGSIPNELLSQGDNWFIFHLLSAGDLASLQRANSHFSQDILSSLLNEPIPGHGVFWSSVGGKPYPVAIRALSFEKLYETRDPHYNRAAAQTYATILQEKFDAEMERLARQYATGELETPETGISSERLEAQEAIDPMAIYRERCRQALLNEREVMNYLNTEAGTPWGRLVTLFDRVLPDHIESKNDFAFQRVPEVLNDLFGEHGWETFRRTNREGKKITQVRKVQVRQNGAN